MTTTGGPERSLAEPALGNAASGDPVVVGAPDAHLDGDDIVVEPHAAVSHPRRRTRELVVGIVIAVLVLAGVAIALASRHSSGGNTHLTSSAAVRPPAASHPNQAPAPVRPKTTPSPPTAEQIAAATTIVPVHQPTTPVTNPSPPVSSLAVSPPATAATAATAPPATMPPSEPPSVLQWTAAPSTLAIKGGGHALLTITVLNPTNGTVTLPQPLSCAPTLQSVHGSPLGGMVCAQMTQLMAPHSKLVQHYTIYATSTGDASGTPLAAGQYLANIESLHNVKVTIRAS